MSYVVNLRRVEYGWGNERIPREKREYRIEGNWTTACGTLDEIGAHLAERGHERVTYRIRDRDGISWKKNVRISK
jgi:hypothetical protein